MYEFLYLFWRNVFAGPCIFPSWFGRRHRLIVTILSSLGSRARAVLGFEYILEEGHAAVTSQAATAAGGGAGVVVVPGCLCFEGGEGGGAGRMVVCASEEEEEVKSVGVMVQARGSRKTV